MINETSVNQKPREYLEKYPDGTMVICTSKPGEKSNGKYYGEEFLLRYSAWGFVKIAREPNYFALYISSPTKAIKYFGVVDEIIDPRKSEHLEGDFSEYDSYESGDKLILLKKDSIIKLEDEIPFKGKPFWGLRYIMLDRFIHAESTKDLWEE